ncbi:hypothetical protein GA0115252_151423 [Streptomyces sp. DfronAA-171]|nr:hypothetical protein GA0115252_151423 [Streptomyces sp. DfronAA-171]
MPPGEVAGGVRLGAGQFLGGDGLAPGRVRPFARREPGRRTVREDPRRRLHGEAARRPAPLPQRVLGPLGPALRDEQHTRREPRSDPLGQALDDVRALRRERREHPLRVRVGEEGPHPVLDDGDTQPRRHVREFGPPLRWRGAARGVVQGRLERERVGPLGGEDGGHDPVLVERQRDKDPPEPLRHPLEQRIRERLDADPAPARHGARERGGERLPPVPREQHALRVPCRAEEPGSRLARGPRPARRDGRGRAGEYVGAQERGERGGKCRGLAGSRGVGEFEVSGGGPGRRGGERGGSGTGRRGPYVRPAPDLAHDEPAPPQLPVHAGGGGGGDAPLPRVDALRREAVAGAEAAGEDAAREDVGVAQVLVHERPSGSRGRAIAPRTILMIAPRPGPSLTSPA